MNRSEFNPLRRELARGRHGEPHPDSDMLTALAEGALPQREREQVLTHLAICAHCREVLSIAAGAATDSSVELKPVLLPRPSLPPHRAWLPWTSVAAGLLVVCLAGLFYQEKQAIQKGDRVATNEAVQLPSSTPQLPPPSPPLERKESPSKTANHPTLKSLQAPSRSQSMTAANVIPEAQIEAAKQTTFGQQNSYQISSAGAGETATPAPPVLKVAPAPTVSAFVNATTERALSSASITAAARPHWRINSTGQPERSFGDGAWQAVLPQEQSKMRVVSVFNGEVWIGGDHSRLYHSTDNGATWNLVVLPDKDGREHSIAHIHFLTAQSGTVESDDGTVWTTSNGGSAWK